MANEYLQANGKLLMTSDGKLVQVPDPENLNDLADEQAVLATLNLDVSKEIEDLIVNGVIDGSPKGVYDNLSSLQTAFPDGASGVYLTSDNGHWYYWNGSAWTDGGVYQTDLSYDEVKEDINQLITDIYDLESKNITIVANQSISVNGTIVQNSSNRCRSGIVSDGNYKIKIKCNNGYKFRPIYYTDDSAITASSAPSFHHLGEWVINGEVILENRFYCRLIIAYENDGDVTSSNDFIQNIICNGFVSKINSIENITQNLTTEKITIFTTWVANGINLNGTINQDTTTRCRTNPVFSGDKVGKKLKCLSGYKFRVVYYTDDSPITAGLATSFHHMSDWITGEAEILLEPNYYVRILLGYVNDETITDVSQFKDVIFITETVQRLDEIENKINSKLTGLKLSLLGDSISAYIGTIPEGNDYYYNGSNSGVSSPQQMWWNVLCEKTGMTPLVINGYSGSGITQLTDTAHINKVPMSDVSRCKNLHSDNVNPDVILIAGGVNDYTYANSSQHNPNSWNGKTTPVSGNSFTETYACMIKDIQDAYPNAIIVCLSTWFTMRGTDNGYTLVNGTGYTQADYDNEIEKVAKIMRVQYINVETCGFNRNNFYPTYAQDSSTIPTHPNATGQKVMGEYIANYLPDLLSAFK